MTAETDPRIAEAKRLLLEVAAERRRRLTGVRPADPARAECYRETLERFAEHRGGRLFHPYLGSGAGAGALVELADGSVKLDMVGGIGVHVLGHGDPALVEAGVESALRDVVMQGNLQQNVESAAIAAQLVTIARESAARLDHCFLTSSGAMANENALKILFQARAPADRLLALDGCFAGRTMALAAITDEPAYREGLPRALSVDYVPFFDPRDARVSTVRAVEVLERHLSRYPGRHAAMVFELVQGEGGFRPGRRDYFVAVMEALRGHGVPVFIDEIQTFGRSTRWFAFQHFGLEQYVDVVTIGKMTQVCATLFSDTVKPRPGLLSQTFTGSTSAILAAAAILDRLGAGGFFGEDGRIARIHARFASQFEGIAKRNAERFGPGVYGWGLGGMIAFEVDGGDLAATKQFLRRLFDAGVVAYYAGSSPARVRFLPPLGAITDGDVDLACEIVERSL
ncbi:MAG: aminotransferase class III-fold pyridoxal phosphate-dependent enzyme [Candidatus Binatia bacterium]